jgi:hypothetical protein
MARRKHDAPLLHGTDAGSGAAMAGVFALPYFNKHGRAVWCAHDQVNFSTTAPWRPIIALQQAQASLLQVAQRSIFSRITGLLAGADRGFDWRGNH